MEGAAFRCKSIEIPSPVPLFPIPSRRIEGGKKNIYIYKEKGWWKIVLAADRRSVDVCGERAKFPGHSKFSERRIKRALSAGQTGTNSIRLVTPCVADGPVNLNGHLHEQGW